MTKPYMKCEQCNKEFSGPEPFTQHLLSKSHMKEIQKQGLSKLPKFVASTSTSTGQKYRCDVCQMDFSGPTPAEQHMNGNKHKSMLNKQRILQENAVSIPNNEHQGNLLKCQTCEKCFSGPESFEDHMRSKKHQRKVDMANMKARLTTQEPASCPPAPGSPAEPNMQVQPGLYPKLPNASLAVPNRAAVEIIPKKKTTGCMAAFKSIVKKKKSKQPTAN